MYGIAPNHIFTVEGVYVVTLKVTADLGFWATDNMTVTVPTPEENGVTSVVTLLLMLVLAVTLLMHFS